MGQRQNKGQKSHTRKRTKYESAILFILILLKSRSFFSGSMNEAQILITVENS